MAKSKLIRKGFPKIRIVVIKGEQLYQVDARKQGTDGKRVYFKSRKEAEQKAANTAAELLAGGTAALLDSKLRDMALEGSAKLSHTARR